MFLQRGCRRWRPLRPTAMAATTTTRTMASRKLSALASAGGRPLLVPVMPGLSAREFHVSSRRHAVKPVLLADIGEGIVECEIIQWFVKPGARVEEFSPLCEVQSDKASVEITSRFAGIVKKLHYDAGDMAKVGKPFVDIDIVGEVTTEAAAAEAAPESEPTPETEQPAASPVPAAPSLPQEAASPSGKKFSGSTLATPAVRHLCKELDVDITQVDGTGKDGRVLKEDLHRYVAARKQGEGAPAPGPVGGNAPAAAAAAAQTETAVPLAGTQLQMFKTMTRSLSIPHFLYADEVDFTQLFRLRQRVNSALAGADVAWAWTGETTKLSYLPFVIKAVSVALHRFPVLNARLDLASVAAGKPQLLFRSQHNIGVAMDTPAGLVVPVVRNVQARSVLSIAGELARLQGLAKAGQLGVADLQGGTFTVSNIGSIGGTYLSPVVVDKEVAILGMGRLRTVPAFADDSDEGAGRDSQRIVKRHVCHFSISADHRLVDGATVARAAEVVRQLVEKPDMMAVQLQ